MLQLHHLALLLRTGTCSQRTRTRPSSTSASPVAEGAYPRPPSSLLRRPLDLVQTMVEITEHMQTRDYVKAHDAYIRCPRFLVSPRVAAPCPRLSTVGSQRCSPALGSCAIGNAPWPMGISGTGVHERQGRQHIRENKVPQAAGWSHQWCAQ